jgi:hypothetical protein
MPERVLRAVASPATIFWAPVLPAAINVAIHALLMIYGWALIGWSPLRFIVTMLVVHMLIAGQGTRLPHMSNLIMCWARTLIPTRNLPRIRKIRRYAP